MPGETWKILTSVRVEAKPPMGLWTVLDELFEGPCYVKIQATGSWNYADEEGTMCGPDGDPLAAFTPRSRLHPSSSIGALLARIGGSTADQTPDGIVAIGSFGVLAVEEGAGGPLFLTMNDAPTGFSGHSGILEAVVSVRNVGQSAAE